MTPAPSARLLAGRYALLDHLASGGMGAVYLGAMRGQAGFVRAVAIKQMHAGLRAQPDLVRMFIDEARTLSRIRHQSVVAPIDFFESEGAFYLVMELLVGESVGRVLRCLVRDGQRMPAGIAARIAHDALLGLSAAHSATDDQGSPLGVIHRDVSPQNLFVGADGVTRVLDFGVAKARQRLHQTVGHYVRGKPGYLAPEQIVGATLDARVDVFTVGVVLWEMLAGRRLYEGTDPALAVLAGQPPPALSGEGHLSIAVDEVIARALAVDPDARFETATAMAEALGAAALLASASDVSVWLATVADGPLSLLRARVRAAEQLDWKRVSLCAFAPGAPPPDAPAAFGLSRVGGSIPPVAGALPACSPADSPEAARYSSDVGPGGIAAMSPLAAQGRWPVPSFAAGPFPIVASEAARASPSDRVAPRRRWLAAILMLHGSFWSVVAGCLIVGLGIELLLSDGRDAAPTLLSLAVSFGMAALHLWVGVRESRRRSRAPLLCGVAALALLSSLPLLALAFALPPLAILSLSTCLTGGACLAAVTAG